MIKFSAVTLPGFYPLRSRSLYFRPLKTRDSSAAIPFPFCLNPHFLRMTFSTILAPASIALPLLSFRRAPLPKSVGCDAMDTRALSSSTRAQTTNRPSFKYFQKESILQKYLRRASSVMAVQALPAENDRKSWL